MLSESKREQDKHDVMIVERIHEDELGDPGTVVNAMMIVNNPLIQK